MGISIAYFMCLWTFLSPLTLSYFFADHLLDRVVQIKDMDIAPWKRGTKEFDARTKPDTKEGKYYIVFASRWETEEEKSLTGHTFVIWGMDDESSRSCWALGYGFYPDAANEKFMGKIIGPGKIYDEWEMGSFPAITNSLTLKVDEDDFKNTLSSIQDKLHDTQQYSLIKNNCIDFVDNVAKDIGINLPFRNPFVGIETPSSYIRKLIEKVDEQTKLTYPDGRLWIGPLLKGIPHGEGRLLNHYDPKYVNFIYEGTFNQGTIEKGTLLDKKNQLKYTGYFVNGIPEMSEVGKLENFKFNTRYVGSVQNGKAHGKGKIDFFNTNEQWVGRWENGRFKNQKATYNDFSRHISYTGEFENGLFHGEGEMEKKVNGSSEKFVYRYIGGFKNGLFHAAKGDLWYDNFNGDRFIGEFKAGKFISGRMILHFSNGSIGEYTVRGEQLHGDFELFNNLSEYEDKKKTIWGDYEGGKIRNLHSNSHIGTTNIPTNQTNLMKKIRDVDHFNSSEYRSAYREFRQSFNTSDNQPNTTNRDGNSGGIGQNSDEKSVGKKQNLRQKKDPIEKLTTISVDETILP